MAIAAIGGIIRTSSRSHFESMDIWHTAMLQPDRQAAGWLNRGVGRQAGAGSGAAIHVGNREIPRALTGDAVAVHSLEGLDQLVRRIGMPQRADTQDHRMVLDRVARLPRGEAGSHLQFIQRSQVVTYASSARIEEILRSGNPQFDQNYPDTQLARRLRLVSQLIQARVSRPRSTTSSLTDSTRMSDSLMSTPRCCERWGTQLQRFLTICASRRKPAGCCCLRSRNSAGD